MNFFPFHFFHSISQIPTWKVWALESGNRFDNYKKFQPHNARNSVWAPRQGTQDHHNGSKCLLVSLFMSLFANRGLRKSITLLKFLIDRGDVMVKIVVSAAEKFICVGVEIVSDNRSLFYYKIALMNFSITRMFAFIASVTKSGNKKSLGLFHRKEG